MEIEKPVEENQLLELREDIATEEYIFDTLNRSPNTELRRKSLFVLGDPKGEKASTWEPKGDAWTNKRI